MIATHDFIRGIILAGYALLFYKLLIHAKLDHFIAPKMFIYIYFAFFAFLLLSSLLIAGSRRNSVEQARQDCDCEGGHYYPSSLLASISVYALFTIPLAVGFLFSDHVLHSDSAENRSIQLSYNKPPESSQLLLGESREIILHDDHFLGSLYLINQHQQKLQGSVIEVKGFIYRDSHIKGDFAAIARFGLSCCTADASVYGILIADPEIESIERDTWVIAKGTLSQANVSGKLVPLLIHPVIHVIEMPKRPYVSE
ncbi:TIGR03943 family protein [Bacillus lacus]|uniref:TIGR03943 family protein n=1 Tax=Metabacillus lacus TaxID=1983721 RepID=A0A7X2J0X9_9BACI|nr:TIGR03943 family protein [Metabacillus lacus]MRX73254.1 TIGR03943 family protein [Metabacillus lacus]